MRKKKKKKKDCCEDVNESTFVKCLGQDLAPSKELNKPMLKSLSGRAGRNWI